MGVKWRHVWRQKTEVRRPSAMAAGVAGPGLALMEPDGVQVAGPGPHFRLLYSHRRCGSEGLHCLHR